MIESHCRWIDRPDDWAVTTEDILLPHRELTIQRMMARRTVLCIQDGTDLDYNGINGGRGFGVTGSNQAAAKSTGLHLHSTLVVTGDGLPLGVLHARCTAPKSMPAHEAGKTSGSPIEEKEDNSWLVGMRDCEDVAARMPGTRVIQVMDRDADLFELFDEWRQGPKHTALLVRARVSRQTSGESHLFTRLRDAEPRGDTFELEVDRQSNRPKKSKPKTRPARPGRTALVTLHFEQVDLIPPRAHNGKEPVSLWAVHLVEEAPPDGVKPVEWFLLHTMEVATTEQARALLDFYCLRWRIEDWRRVLKCGCSIEDLRDQAAEQLERAIAIYMVMAWRIMLMMILGREVPDLPPDVLFSDIELEVLHAYAKTRRDVKPPTTLGNATLLVSRLGGYMARSNDPPPGHEVMWNGCTSFDSMCAGYLLRRQAGESNWRRP